MRFASLLSSGFTTMAVINPPEKKLENRTSVHCLALKFFRKDSYLLILREIQTDQNLVFIFHDRQIFLALLVK